MEPNRCGFIIMIETVCEGRVPSVRGDNGMPFVFETRLEAERDIADTVMMRLQEFMDGERDFDDAITVEEFVVEVDVLPDGSITDADDNHFGTRRN